MAKYRVSLAILVPHNFEVHVEAKDEKEALMKGVDIYNSPDWDKHGAYIDEEQVGDAELNIHVDGEVDVDEAVLKIEEGEFKTPDDIIGVYVEEVK